MITKNSKQTTKLLFILLNYLQIFICYVKAASTTDCAATNGTTVQCIPFTDCGPAVDLVQKYKTLMPPEIRDHLVKIRCNANADKIHICCDLLDIKAVTPNFLNVIKTNERTVASEKLEEFIPGLNMNGLKILNDTQCGKSKINRIAFGEEVDLSEFPWMALLRYNTRDHPFKCGGTLITDRYVLTAAHCVKGLSFSLIGVRLGEHNIETEVDCQKKGKIMRCAPPVEDFGIEKVIAHPSYSRQLLTFDVALIKLSRSVSFKSHIQPICLPITKRSKVLEDDQKYFIAGWGTTEMGTPSNVLTKAIVPYKDLQVCQDIFTVIAINENHICAGGEARIDSCKGDSGGPLFFLAPYKRLSRFVQYGIVSFGGIRCGAEKNYPGVYANVSQYMSWITSNID